ncbi:MAG TPA: hypothetical protein VH440_00355 [Candidatus Limnocylindrales bacterium]
MTDFSHRASRVVEQTPAVVHERLLELVGRLRDEAPPIEPGTQPAALLGITGSLGIEVADRGPGRIELRTTRGRVRAAAAADIAPADPMTGDAAAGAGPAGDRTMLSILVVVRPQGFAANLMLSAALGARPNLRLEIVEGLEGGFTDLARELAKPDGEWDASAWRPPGLP